MTWKMAISRQENGGTTTIKGQSRMIACVSQMIHPDPRIVREMGSISKHRPRCARRLNWSGAKFIPHSEVMSNKYTAAPPARP